MKSREEVESRLKTKIIQEKEQLEKECSDLQREKQELFKKLLKQDDLIPNEEEGGDQ